MHVWLDTPVVTSDGATVGRVSNLIVHPASWKVLTVVVTQGRLLIRRYVGLSLELVNDASRGGISLQIDRPAFSRLPNADPRGWQRAPRDWLTPLGWPPGRIYWPAGYQGAVYPELRASQLKRWGTLRAAGWVVGPRRELSTVVEEPAALPELEGSDRRHIPGLAAGRLEIEAAREQRGESLFDVDPYDVLGRTSECGFTTPFERDDASVINPQPYPPGYARRS